MVCETRCGFADLIKKVHYIVGTHFVKDILVINWCYKPGGKRVQICAVRKRGRVLEDICLHIVYVSERAQKSIEITSAPQRPEYEA